MKSLIVICVCFFVVLPACDIHIKRESTEVSAELRESVSVKLENIALEFLKSWEPPFDPDAALAMFTQTADFHLVIDGGYTCDNYAEWTNAVPGSMSHEEEFYSSYAHEVAYIETVVLSPESGVVTIVYIWDSISKEGVHERTPGAITMTCRKETDTWRIVHYHGSHGEPEVIDG